MITERSEVPPCSMSVHRTGKSKPIGDEPIGEVAGGGPPPRRRAGDGRVDWASDREDTRSVTDRSTWFSGW